MKHNNTAEETSLSQNYSVCRHERENMAFAEILYYVCDESHHESSDMEDFAIVHCRNYFASRQLRKRSSCLV